MIMENTIIAKKDLLEAVENILALIESRKYTEAKPALEELAEKLEASINSLYELTDISEDAKAGIAKMQIFVDKKVELGEVDDLSIDERLKRLDPKIKLTNRNRSGHFSFLSGVKESFKESFGKRRNKKTNPDDEYNIGGDDE